MIIIFFIIGIAATILILTVKYKRKKFLESFGLRYSKIIDLNSNQSFAFKNFNYTFNISVESKRKLDNLSLYEIAMMGFNENEGNIRTFYTDYIEEKSKYEKYLKKFYEITEEIIEYNPNIVKNTILFSNINSFIKYEIKMINKIRIVFTYKYIIYVRATYDSPGGRNHWYKNNSYNAEDVHDFIKILNQRNEYQKTKKYQREIMSDSLRYDILKRDGYRCKICGASASDGARLEVDHIIPVAKGGKTTKNNLQTLCDSCNRGKRDKYM